MLEKLHKIEVENPVDLIISQIRDLINSGVIKEGEKLPPERKLAAQFGVSRNQVREAIRKLQIYGIVSVLPQSGTIVNGIGMGAFAGLITNLLKIEDSDFKSLVDTRIVLEKESAKLAAMNRTSDDLANMSKALDLFEQKMKLKNVAIEEDLHFHVKIAEAGKNSVLKTLMMIITPGIVESFTKFKICDAIVGQRSIDEHRKILEMISERNPNGAMEAMGYHLNGVSQFSKKN